LGNENDSLWQKEIQNLNFDKPALVVFTGSDWCRNCMKLHDLILNDPVFLQATVNDFDLVLVDLPRAKKLQAEESEMEARKELARHLNPGGVFPFFVVVTDGGEIIQETTFLGEDINDYLKWIEEAKGKV
jgi:thioredoxin-related protein